MLLAWRLSDPVERRNRQLPAETRLSSASALHVRMVVRLPAVARLAPWILRTASCAVNDWEVLIHVMHAAPASCQECCLHVICFHLRTRPSTTVDLITSTKSIVSI